MLLAVNTGKPGARTCLRAVGFSNTGNNEPAGAFIEKPGRPHATIQEGSATSGLRARKRPPF